MRTIRIKLKHLFYIILLIIAFVFLVPRGMLLCADKLSNKNIEISNNIYKKYIGYFPLNTKKDEALYKLAWNILSVKKGSYFEKIDTMGSSAGSIYADDKMVRDSIEMYMSIVKNYKNRPYYRYAYNNLMFLYTYSGRINEGNTLIKEGLSSKDTCVMLSASKYAMLYSMADRNFEHALEIGKKVISSNSSDNDIYKLMGDIYLQMKEYNNAVYFYEKVKNNIVPGNGKAIEAYSLYMGQYPYDRINAVRTLNRESASGSKVHGTVKINGNPVPFAYVYLKDINDTSFYSDENERDALFSVTNSTGNYEISGIPAGDYKLMIVISGIYLNNAVLQENANSNFYISATNSVNFDFNFIPPFKIKSPIGTITPKANFVDLEWENVKGAAYYQIHAVEFDNPSKFEGSCGWYPIATEIYTNHYRIDIDDVNIWSHGFSSSEDGLLNPQSYLGVFCSGSRIPLFVNAYDKNGLLITSTAPKKVIYDNLTIVQTSQSNIPEGDRAILNRKPEAAVKYYEETLKKKPNDIHSMTVLSNIYSLGTRVRFGPKEIREGQNLSRAIELNDKLYSLTGNPEYIRRNIFIYEYERKDYAKVLESLSRIPAAQLKYSDYQTMGEASLTLNKMNKAAEAFKKMETIQKYSPATEISPFLFKLYTQDYGGSIRMLNSMNLRLYRISKVMLAEDVDALSKVKTSDPDYKKFKKALETVFTRRLNSNFSSDYISLRNQVKNTVISDILYQIGNYYSLNDVR